MLINETTTNCCKPKRFITFTGGESSGFKERKITAKHYEEMSDEVLQLRSVLKAHSDVQKSGKMQFFKAMPAITTGLLGTIIALTQPGKLATKVASGLGFLALSEVVNNGCDKIFEQIEKNKNSDENQSKKALSTLAKVALGVGVGVGAFVALKNTKTFKSVACFATKELKQLSDEINKTSLAKFFDEKIAPFTAKHKKTFDVLRAVSPFGAIAGSTFVQIELADSLSNDIKNKTCENYIKGKMIQATARAHYDSIDAMEV